MYVVIDPNGQTLIVIVTPASVDYATGTANSAGQLAATTIDGLNVSLDVSTSGISATLTSSLGTSINFNGLPSSGQSTSRLVNLSARADIGAGGNVLITGFVIGGIGTKQLLLRGIGPALAQFGINNALANPQLLLMDSNGVQIAADTSWGGYTLLATLFTQVGAFPLAANSADSVLLVDLDAGAYTAELLGMGNTSGVALNEIYDADTGTPTARLVNISARADVGTGGDILIAGFVITGNSPETVLIRGVGPTLGEFGLGLFDVLNTPQLTLYDSNNNIIATNTGWANSASLAATSAQVGAFALLPGSSDDAMVVTLLPGAYTAEVSGINESTGIALVEIYEVPTASKP
jgi:hypothetical protein